MFYIETSSINWSKKHGLDIESATCSLCKKEFLVDVPIRVHGYAGFEMRKHGCPDNRLSATFTPTGQKEIDSWNKIMKPVTEQWDKYE